MWKCIRQYGKCQVYGNLKIYREIIHVLWKFAILCGHWTASGPGKCGTILYHGMINTNIDIKF
jgi:hypothetical protein